MYTKLKKICIRKSVLAFSTFLIIVGVFGQFEYEHSYPTTDLGRKVLEQSGEKYYYYDPEKRALQLFNANHTFWKEIPIPDCESKFDICALSESPIGLDDDQLKVLYECLDSAGVKKFIVVNDSGMKLQELVEGFVSIKKDIIIYSYYSGAASVRILQLNDFSIQHEYEGFNINFTDLQNGNYRLIGTNSSDSIHIFDESHRLLYKIGFTYPDYVTDKTSGATVDFYDDDPGLEFDVYYYDSEENKLIWQAVDDDGRVMFQLEEIPVFLPQAEPNQIVDDTQAGKSQAYLLPGFTLGPSYPKAGGSGSTFWLNDPEFIYTIGNFRNNTLLFYRQDGSLGLSKFLNDDQWDIRHGIFRNSEQELVIFYRQKTNDGPDVYNMVIIYPDDTRQIFENRESLGISKISNHDTKLFLRGLSSENITDVYGEGIISDIDEIDTNELKIYPNPTTDVVWIDIFYQLTQSKYEIIDFQGTLLKRGNLVAGTNELNLREFPDGVYLFKMANGKNFSTRKILKINK